MHVAGAQQSAPPPHISPSTPHPVVAGWHRASTSLTPMPQTPEQQSPPAAHVWHSARQPDEATQSFVPFGCGWQEREQQSSLPPHSSPICRVHVLRSFSMQAESAAQWPTDMASSTHSPVQQSALFAQTSPCTRQPSRRPQRFIVPGPAGPHT